MAVLVSNFYLHVARKPSVIIKHCVKMLIKQTRRCCGHKGAKPAFGLLFDIDGVIVRGKKVLPSALEAFRRLVDSEGKFRVPTAFVTNAGNAMRHDKAKQLSSWLKTEVHEKQVVMAHSPLKMFQQYHSKRVLISGQGPIVEIAKNLGFSKIVYHIGDRVFKLFICV
jgi:HAD superfamily hydrolase (TIGR01456 family)